MKKHQTRLLALVAGLWLVLAAATSQAALNSAQLDLIQQVQGEGANVTITARVWIKGEKARVETKHPMMGDQLVIVDGTTLYVLSPAQKAGQKGPLPTRNGKKANVWQLLQADVDSLRSKGKKVGRETLQGVACDIYVGNQSREGATQNVKAWIGTVQGTAIPMKVIVKHTMSRPGATLSRTQTMVIKNLKANVPVANSVFSVPKDYKIATGSSAPSSMPGPPGAGRP